MRSLINKCYFAIIKANKQRAHSDLCIQHINACRQLLKVGKKSTLELQENCKKYIQQRASERISVANSKEIFKKWEEIRPIQSQVNALSFSSELNAKQVKYINNVAVFWGNFLMKQAKNKNDGNKTKQQLETSLQDYHKTLNYLIYLMTPNQNNLALYLRVYTTVRDFKLIKEKNHSQLRYVFDKILLLPSLSEQTISQLLYFSSRYPLSYIYHEKSKDIADYIYSKISVSQIIALKNPMITMNLIFSLIQNPEPPMDLIKSVTKLLESKATIPIKLRTFALLCQLFIINKESVKNPVYLNTLKQLIKQGTIQIWIELSRLFYLMEAWIDEFWVPYFEFMSKDDNHLKARKSHHFIIDDLLSEGEGGVQLQKQAQTFRKLLKSKDFDIKDFDLRKQQEQYYGRAVSSKFSCQLHVANSLRLICMGEVLTEVAVKYFLVDVMINKKVIIQINNVSHYKIINGEWKLNLKSQFRERVLKKAGYVCKNLRLQDYTSSNYVMLQEIYKIVQETKDLKQKKKNNVENNQ